MLFRSVENQTYYIKTVTGPTTFTISQTLNGSTFLLVNNIGFMVVTLPAVSSGQPTIKTYNFTLELLSPYGNDLSSYSITVINQNTPVSQGGPGLPNNSRIPTIYNTRPPTYNLNDNDIYYGYYIQPTVSPTIPAFMGTYQSDNYFSFKVIGHDFDSNALTYNFSSLPLGLVGNTVTGWITGTPILSSPGVNNYTFNVNVSKVINPNIYSATFNFSFNVANNISTTVIWLTDGDLGLISNGLRSEEHTSELQSH